jgi:hypothetical protein
MMQQKLQELGQENMELKSGAQVQQMKIASDAQSKQAELALKAQNQAEELRLAREKAEAEIAIKVAVAEADRKIEIGKLQIEQENKSQQLEFEKQCHAEEEASKRAEQVKTEEVAAVPVFTKSLESIVQAFAQALDGQSQALMLLAQAQNKPKTVTLNGVQRNSGGDISGASATVQ